MMSKNRDLEKLFISIKEFYGDTDYVFSVGDIMPRIMLIGEAPGKEELKQGIPFVGSAGKNLNEFLEKVGIEREAVYITNVFKHGLRKLNDRTGRMVNRPAKKDEIVRASAFLKEEISIIKPDYVVTLGNTALWAVIDDFGKKVGEMHGKRSKRLIKNREYFFYPMYHPASLIYNRSLRPQYLDDMKNLSVYFRS